MLMYLLQQRRLRFLGEEHPEFPGEIELTIQLSFPEYFGTQHGRTQIGLAHNDIKIVWDANTGFTWLEMERPLPLLNASHSHFGYNWRLEGNQLSVRVNCEKASDFESLMNILQTAITFQVPGLLNYHVYQPAIVDHIAGSIGSARFVVEYYETQFPFTITGEEILQDRITKAVEMIASALPIRLTAALHYFHKVSRLLLVGSSPWEFMSEVLVNFDKCLNVLFGTREEIRHKLSQLGYSSEQIETDFVPLLLLRNKFDGGHAKLSVPPEAELQLMYQYLTASKHRFLNSLNVLSRNLSKKLSSSRIKMILNWTKMIVEIGIGY